MNFVAIDFETANERRDSACSIGLTAVRDGEIKESVQYLIRPPELRFAYFNTKVHGIREIDVLDASTFAELWPTIRGLIEDQLVVAHNASFDLSVLRHSLSSASIPVPRISYLCSLQVARRAWPHFPSHGLSYLSHALDIELEHHDAGSDSRAAASVILLAGEADRHTCPIQMAESLGLYIGEILSHDDWTPCSAPRVTRDAAQIEVALPEGYDISQHPFFEKQIEFTGTLKLFTRDEAWQIVARFGGRSTDSVSKKTRYLVTGCQDLRKLASGTSEVTKLRKARLMRESGSEIEIISETDFTALIFNPARQEKRG